MSWEVRFKNGVCLPQVGWWLDAARSQQRSFVSHAHSDHMARHEYALCTPATGQLYCFRYGARTTREMPYREPLEWGGLKLTTYPAGHCLGSAMLLAEDGEQSLLYTGDFKLGESATSERAELPHADVLVIESTYGNPIYRHPPRDQVLDQLFTLVRRTLERGMTPVIEAYTLGKSQEITRLLTSAGFPVLQHPKIYEISQIYRTCGVDLGDCHLYAGQPLPGHAVVVPPRMHRAGRLPGLRNTVTFAVTGWATHERTRERLGVDHAIPLSDHADYDELFEAVERVAPRVIYCTHGPVSFVDCLRAAGHNAFPLEPQEQEPTAVAPAQMRLF